jgi:hypothetical protein
MTETENKLAWTEANQRYLMAAIAEVRSCLGAYVASVFGEENPVDSFVVDSSDSLREQMDSPPALERLCSIFHLSSFEKAILLGCAGMELDAQFAHMYAKAQQGVRAAHHPTFGVFLSACNDAHWDALSPAATLRYWRLIEVGSGDTLLTSPLRIDEHILHYLTGTAYLDERLSGLMEPVRNFETLPPSQQELAERSASVWGKSTDKSRPVLIQLCGSDSATRQAIAANVCVAAGLSLYRISANALPLQHTEIHALLRLVGRETLLSCSAILLDCQKMDASDSARKIAVHFFVEGLNTPLIVATQERDGGYLRPAAFFEVSKPLLEEQRFAWCRAIHGVAPSINGALNGYVDSLVAQFNMSDEQIRASSMVFSEDMGLTPEQLMNDLWNSCRMQARPSLDDLALRVDTNVTWDALVLPQPQIDTLRDIAIQMRYRARVYNSWGFGDRGGRGLGITALFAGVSGTGKTTAAEVLAHELKLDLYRIDLSQVVSKYIGETEKSLRRIFDAAEEGGALLFFDEADALFGRRTEVKDSHDRYANIEVSYLLQRMESYRGLAVLATNMKQALDPAFLRRIRFIVQFPFPDASLREEIWKRVIPAGAPVEGVNVQQLSRLSVTGGNIRNIALNAAFSAAKAEQPIRMSHLLDAARKEYQKLEKPLTETEIRGWV